MIKILGIGLWTTVAALGSSYVFASMQGPSETPHKEASYFEGLDWKRTDGITVPILAADRIAGYVLARFVYTVDGEKAAKLAVPPDSFILNDAFTAVYMASGFDFHAPQRYDLDALKASIKESVNKRYGEEIVHDVMVEQFDFLPKNEMNGAAGQRAAVAPAPAVASAAPASAPAH